MAIELNASHIATIADAGKAWATGNTALVAKLGELRAAGVDGETIDHYRDTFYANAIATACSISVKAAELQVSLKPFDFKKPDEATDKHRTPSAQRTFNSAKMAWSRGRDAAGFAPKKVAARKAKTADEDAGEPQGAREGEKLMLALRDAAIEPCADVQGAIELVTLMSSLLRRVHDADPNAFNGDAGAILRGAMTDLANAASDAQASLDLELEAIAA